MPSVVKLVRVAHLACAVHLAGFAHLAPDGRRWRPPPNFRVLLHVEGERVGVSETTCGVFTGNMII
eukprot:8056431-Pyramimonas_sp.AAC.1